MRVASASNLHFNGIAKELDLLNWFARILQLLIILKTAKVRQSELVVVVVVKVQTYMCHLVERYAIGALLQTFEDGA